MKKLLFILLFFSSFYSIAQSKRGLAQKRIIFIGNSIFNKDGANTINQKYTSRTIRDSLVIKGYYGYPVFDYSKSGQTTSEMLIAWAGLKSMVRRGDIVVFTEMTNDQGGDGLTALQSKNKILQYRDSVQARGALFVLQGAIACNSGTLPGYANLTTTLQAENDYFRNTPSLVNAFSDPGALSQCDTDADCSNATYYLPDGIHPTTVLENLMITLLINKIISLF